MMRFYYIVLLIFSLSCTVAGQKELSGFSHAVGYTPWHLSPNPAAVHFLPTDSLLEARVGYEYVRQPLSLSDRPEKEKRYGASADGYNRFGRLSLAGGLSWQQYRREGVYYNRLLQPDYLVTAGDTLGSPSLVEEYRIYGKAAYHLTPSLTTALSGEYEANSNKEDNTEKRFNGNSHTTHVSTGIIYMVQRIQLGLSASYIHRAELLAYGSNQRERLYTYPMGYFLFMGDFNADGNGGIMRSGGTGSNFLFRSTGNEWQLSADARWQGIGWNWFNTLSLSRLRQNDNPDKSGNMKGWEEEFNTLTYRSCLTLDAGRWTHRITPSFVKKQGTSDRILQRVNYESLSYAWETYAIYRLAARKQTQVEIAYEAIQDYTSFTDRQAWEFSAGWYRHREEFYSYPLTISQTTATLLGKAAYRHTFRLPRTARLTIRPNFTIQNGYGTEEGISQPTGTPETDNKLRRSYARVSNDYAARTATRLLYGLQLEYRKEIFSGISTGIRLQGQLEQVTGDWQETGSGVYAGLVLWL